MELPPAAHEVISAHLGEPVRLERVRRLSGGASRQTWSVDAGTGTGTGTGRAYELIIRMAPPRTAEPAAPEMSGSLVGEARLLRAAAAAGVPVPEVYGSGELDTGGEYLVMRRIEGETIPRRILRDDRFAAARQRLAAQCGAALAAIHRIPADAVPWLDRADQLDTWRDVLDATGEPHPAFELALAWLAEHRPPARPPAVVHGDFRNGNLVVGPEGLRAVLDWELTHLGDPVEDLGWLCVKAWRFGSPLPVGGFGDRARLLEAYAAAGGGPVDPAALRWWEVLGTLKWGIICILQARRHLDGGTRSVELAVLGRRVCETEWDLLDLLGAGKPA